MKILVELPSTISDTVMITPALQNLFKHYKNAHFTFVGNSVSSDFFKNDKRISKIYVEDKNKSILSIGSLFKIAKNIGEQDLSISFNKDLYSKSFLFFVNSKIKEVYIDNNGKVHKVEKYNQFINSVLNSNYKAGDLMLYFKPQWFKKRTFGIHPGSVYAEDKRWDANEFTKVAKALSSKYDIVLLGGKAEIDICSDIEKQLEESSIPCTNLAGKTSTSDLIEKIAALDLFLTIDAGPMQIASVYRVNTIIVPVTYKDIYFRNQWKNPLENIVFKEDDLYEENDEDEVNARDVLKLFN